MQGSIPTSDSIACPKCGKLSSKTSECPYCGVIFAKVVEDPRIREWRREREQRSKLFAGEVKDRFGYGGFAFHLAALPVAALTAVVLYYLVLPTLLLDWFSVFCHELGHSLIFWLSGRAATPLALGPGLGWASGKLEQSWWVFCCFTFLVGVIGASGIKHKSPGLIGLAAALLVSEIYFTFIASLDTWDAIMIYAGIGGEFVFGTLLTIGFYYRLPDKLRWDFFRFPALVIGLYTYGKAALLWHRVKIGAASIPFGTFLKAGDEGGDMNRLVHGHGWSEQALVGVYLTTALVCGLTILVHYLLFAWLARRREQTARSQTGQNSIPG
jgi:hypothetical protein